MLNPIFAGRAGSDKYIKISGHVSLLLLLLLFLFNKSYNDFRMCQQRRAEEFRGPQ